MCYEGEVGLATAAPFDHTGDGRGVLLLHGFTGTPFEMAFLGERLAAHAGTTWRDWLASAEAALAALRRRCDRVAVVGLSMGALLALRLARQHPAEIAALGLLAAPLWLPWPARVPLPVLRRLGRRGRLPALPKLGFGPDVRDREMRRQNPELGAVPLAAVVSLAELRAEGPAVTTPVVIAHGRRDHTAAPACARELAARLGSRDRVLRWLERSFHIITIDVEREELAADLGRFLAERM